MPSIPGQKELDWNAPAAQPLKHKALDALKPLCGCVRKVIESTGKPGRGCSCARRLRSILGALDMFQQRKEFCWPSVATLASRVGCTERTTQRLLRLAKALGFIQIIPQTRSTSHYRILWSVIWNALDDGRQIAPSKGDNLLSGETSKGDNLVADGCQIATPDGCQIVTQNSTSLNSMKSKHDGNSERPKAKASGFFEGEDQGWHCHLDSVHLTDVEYLITTFAPRAAANKLIPSGRNGEVVVLAAAWIALKGETPGGLFWTLLKQPAKAWMTSAAGDVAIKQVQQFRGRQPISASCR